MDHRGEGYVEEGAGRDDALRGDRPAQGRDRVVLDERPRTPGVVDGLAEGGVLLAGLAGGEHLDDAADVERLGQCLGTLGEEEPLLDAAAAPAELAGRLDAPAPRGQWGGAGWCGHGWGWAPVSQVMNPNCLFTHSAWCVKRQEGFLTWETGRPRVRPTRER